MAPTGNNSRMGQRAPAGPCRTVGTKAHRDTQNKRPMQTCYVPEQQFSSPHVHERELLSSNSPASRPIQTGTMEARHRSGPTRSDAYAATGRQQLAGPAEPPPASTHHALILSLAARARDAGRVFSGCRDGGGEGAAFGLQNITLGHPLSHFAVLKRLGCHKRHLVGVT